MKTKITLITITLIFALILCGAVAAEDTSNQTSTNQSDNITVNQNTEISGEELSDPYNPRLDRHYYGANGIADALNDPQLQEGDTIEVEAGTYNFLVINTRVNLIATETNAIIQGIQIGTLSTFTGSNYLEINGFIINNTLGPGIEINNVNGVKILNNEIVNNLAVGIGLDQASNIIIYNNIIHDNQGAGIDLKCASNNQITDNQINSNNGLGPNDPGVNLQDSSDNTISGNIISKNGGAGVSLEGSPDNIINNNKLENNDREGVILTDSSGNHIEDNQITENGYAGIFLQETPDGEPMENTNGNDISNNIIQNNNLEGIRIEGSPNNEIYDNTIKNNGNDGISVNFAEGNIIGTDNQIVDNQGNGVYVSSSPSTMIISNNIAGNERNQIEVSEGILDGNGENGVGGGEGQVENGVVDEVSNDNPTNGPIFTYVHFNRIIATPGNFAILNTGTGIVYAELNWWGSNNGPTPEQDVGRDIIYDPWLVMRFNANPTTIHQGDTSTLTADFRYDSNGVFHDPTQGDGGRLPTGLFVKFTTTLGNVGSKEISREIVNSVATAILRGDEAAGIAIAGALFDSQPKMTAIVTITASATSTASNSAYAADTVSMQETGTPIGALILTVIMVLGGMIVPKRK